MFFLLLDSPGIQDLFWPCLYFFSMFVEMYVKIIDGFIE